MISHAEFLEKLTDYHIEHPSQRYGQAVFNLMYELLPAYADIFRGSHMDPFYKDDRAGAFIEACIRIQPDWCAPQKDEPMKEVTN